jgi:hypothetical protein
MRDDLQYAARRVFAEFIAGFEQREGQRNWGMQISAQMAQRMGLSPGLLRGAFELLRSENMIEFRGTNHTLTDLGYRACLHRELIDEILGSPAAARGVGLHFSAQNVIIGDGNTLQVNSDEVIAKLVAHITADDAIEPEKKRQWVEILKEITGHVAAEGLKVVLDKAMGK